MALDNRQIYEALLCAISNVVLSGYTDTNIKTFFLSNINIPQVNMKSQKKKLF